MNPEDVHPIAAELLLHDAHAMRNDVATLRSVVQLTEDEAIRDALAESTSRLQRSIERAVTAARLDTDAVRERASIPFGTLLQLAARRAARETSPAPAPELPVPAAVAAAEVLVATQLAERLLTDALHLGLAPARAFELVDAVVRVSVAPTGAPSVAMVRYLATLADAAGCVVVRAGEGPSFAIDVPLSGS